jgi:outer membrane protein TolC
MRRPSSILAVASAALLAETSLAQPPPAPAPPPARPAQVAPAPVTPSARVIEVDDPLLEPVKPPRRTLSSWREVVALVSTRSPDVIIGRSGIERAEGAWRQALAGSLPSLTGTGTIAHNFIRTDIPATAGQPATTIPSTPTASAALTLSQPILAPRAWYSIGTADLSIRVARLSASDKERVVLGVVANAIVTVVTSERLAEINRVGLRSALQVLELTQRKQRLGSGTKLDVVRAQQDVGIARATLITGDEALRKAREALGAPLGEPAGYGVATSISLNEIQNAIRATCSPGTAEERADVLSAKASLEVARRGVTDAKLAFAPTAAVSSTASVGTDEQASGKTYAWSIQGVLTVPIWEGGARYGTLRIANAAVTDQRALVDSALVVARQQTVQAQRGVLVAEQARQVSEQTRDLARETARLSQVAFEAGTGTSFDLVDSARREREAELDLVVKEFEVIRARATALLASANCRL